MYPPLAAPLALFVYYRVPHAQLQAAGIAVRDMQAGLVADWPGLQTRLMRRADEPASGHDTLEQTWMEVYEHPQGVSDATVQAIASAAHGLPAGLLGTRHVETFVPLTTPPA